MTILFVDQVGSTAQLSVLGDRSAVALHDELHVMVTAILDAHHGVYRQYTGDGFMATFDSCVNAVDCALSLHESLTAANVRRPPEERLVMRMGVHTGEPLLDGAVPFGAAIVTAARLCELAGAGQVLASEVVRVLLEPRRSFQLVAVGERRLKGFAEPIGCYLVQRPGDPLAALVSTDAPFVGRDVELDVLRLALVEAAESTAKLVVVAGDRGVGKTRLAQEFAAEGRQRGARLVHAVDRAGVDALVAAPPDELSVLIIEDVTDRTTLARLAAHVHNHPGQRVLVIAVAAELGLADGLDHVTVLHLDKLSATATDDLIRTFGARPEVGEVVRQLDPTGSSPGTVRELLEDADRAALRDDIDLAIGRAATGHVLEQRASAAAASGLVALATELGEPLHVPVGDVAPYKGLVSYAADDGRWFCGRERATAELIARVAMSRFVAVTGPSGSGKSSLVHAGLLPALRAGVVMHSERWPILSLTPHGHPLAELSAKMIEFGRGDSPTVLASRLQARPTLLADLATRAMEDRPEGSRLILIVDQFEEAFTSCDDEAERTAFFDALVHASQVQSGPTTVLIALRGDYYGHCSQHAELARRLAASHCLVGPMSLSEIRLAIEEPARRAGLSIDDELVDRAVDEAGGGAATLPLLSTAMLETWRRRHNDRLTLDAYTASGGVHGAIARLAESVYEELSPDERDALRAMLLRLAEIGEDGDDVRRRAARSELVTSPVHVHVLDLLVSHRLVTVDAERVEVAHEALLREWPRLRTWLEEDRAGRRLHRALTSDAQRWEDGGRQADLLYRGLRLDSVVEWSSQHTGDLHPMERGFVEASVQARRQELTRSRRAARRFRTLAIALAILLAFAVTAGALAWSQRNRAEQRATTAEATRLANLSGLELNGDNLRVASLLAIEAWRTSHIDVSEGALLSSRRAYGSSTDVLAVQTDGGLDVSPHDVVAIAQAQGVGLWDLETGVHQDTLESDGGYSLSFSPTGTSLAAMVPGSEVLSVQFWDVAAKDQLSHIDLPNPDDMIDVGLGTMLGWYPDGSRAVLANDDETRLVEIVTGAVTATLPAARAVVVTRDGRTIALLGETTIDLFDGQTLEQSGELDLPATSGPGLGFSRLVQGPGDVLIYTGDQGPAAWDLATRATVDLGLPKQLFSLGVSRDGTLAIVDGSAIWDLRTKRPVSIISTNDFGLGTDIGQFSADGSQLVTSAGFGIVRVMPTRLVRGRSAQLGPFPGDVVHAVPASEGRVTIVGVEYAPDAFAGPFDTPPGEFVAALVDPAEERILTTVPLGVANDSAVSRDGHVVAVRHQGDGVNTIQLVDVTTGTSLRRIESRGTAPPPQDGPQPLGATFSLSSDGGVLAFADERGILHLVDTATGRQRATVEVEGAGRVFSAFTPDDRLAVVRGQAEGDTGGGSLGMFTLDGGAMGEPLQLGDDVHVAGVATTADAILVGSDQQVIVVSHDGRSVLGRISGYLGTRALDAGSGRVAIDGDAGLRLWDLRTRLPIGEGIGAGYGPWWRSPVIATEAGRSVLYEFASPGSTLFVTRTTLDPDQVVAELCEFAGGNLTDEEWAQYFPGTRYRATCGS